MVFSTVGDAKVVTLDSKIPPAGGPPDHTDKAAVARWMVRNNSWGSMATISTMDGMKGTPLTISLATTYTLF